MGRDETPIEIDDPIAEIPIDPELLTGNIYMFPWLASFSDRRHSKGRLLRKVPTAIIRVFQKRMLKQSIALLNVL
jgi:hypothetical protein